MMTRIRNAVVSVALTIGSAVLTVLGLSRLLKKIGEDVEPTVSRSVQESHEESEDGGKESADATSEAQVSRGKLQLPQPRPGWNAPKPAHLSEPTYWPATMALSITLILWGIITSFLVSLAGLLLFSLALGGWIAEMRHESRDQGASLQAGEEG